MYDAWGPHQLLPQLRVDSGLLRALMMASLLWAPARSQHPARAFLSMTYPWETLPVHYMLCALTSSSVKWSCQEIHLTGLL